MNRHEYAYAARRCDAKMVITPGYYQWRDGGEKHMNDPLTVANLQVIYILLNIQNYVFPTKKAGITN